MSYIDKITDKDSGESRIISPAADAVRVDNENFDGTDLDEVLDDIAEAIEDAGSGGYAPPPGGIPATDLAPAVQTSLGKADSAVQPGDLSAVATSGNYNDLSNKPTIPDVSGLATKTELNMGLADKVDVETGKSLMSDAEHTKLENLPTAAELEQALADAGVDVSVTTNQDGTFVIHVGETDYTINLNHTHPQYVKYQLMTQAQYDALTTKDSSTLYLIPEQ